MSISVSSASASHIVQARKGGGGSAFAPWNTNPSSRVLFGSSNSAYSKQQIYAALTQPGMTPRQALDLAVAHRVPLTQIAQAGAPGYTMSNMVSYVKSQGIPVPPQYG